MAGGYPVGLQWSPVGTNAISSSGGVNVTAAASSNTVGAYSELISSTPRDVTWCAIALRDTITGTGPTNSAINIATGASGSEVVKVSNLVVSRASISSQEGGGSMFVFPLSVPSGTRVAASCQTTGISVVIRCAITLFDDAFGSVPGGGAVDTYGFNTSTSIGVQIDPGATANTKGAWSEITPSLNYDLSGFFLAFDGGGTNTTSSIVLIDLDIGVGASGSEVPVLPDWQFVITCTSPNRRDINPATTPFFPIPIPAGTRISARAACSTSTSTVRVFGVTFYGVRM
jgi:hypothetical protein